MSEQEKPESFPDYIGDLDRMLGGMSNIPTGGPLTGNVDRIYEKIRKTFLTDQNERLRDLIRNGDYSRSKPTELGWVRTKTLTEADAKAGYSWTLQTPIPGTLPPEFLEFLAAHPPVHEDWIVPNMEPADRREPFVVGEVIEVSVYRDAKFPNNQIEVS